MNLFYRELKANTRSLLIWGVIVQLIVFAGTAEFAAYEGNPEILAVLDGFPPALLDAFNFEAFNLTTVTGFFGIMSSYFSLLLSLAAVMWGSDIITKEERDKTAEFTLVLPVSRSKVVTAKTAAALVNCILLLFITWVGLLLNLAKYEPDSSFYSFVSLSMLAFFIVQLIFLALGILLGCALKRYKRANSLAVSLLLGTYFISIIAGLSEDLGFLRYFSPLKYFDPKVLHHEQSLDAGFVALSAAIVAVAMAGAYVTYSKRDLHL